MKNTTFYATDRSLISYKLFTGVILKQGDSKFCGSCLNSDEFCSITSKNKPVCKTTLVLNMGQIFDSTIGMKTLLKI